MSAWSVRPPPPKKKISLSMGWGGVRNRTCNLTLMMQESCVFGAALLSEERTKKNKLPSARIERESKIRASPLDYNSVSCRVKKTNMPPSAFRSRHSC